MLDETALKFGENRGTFVLRYSSEWYNYLVSEEDDGNLSLLGNKSCLNLLIENNFIFLLMRFNCENNFNYKYFF